MRFGGSPMTCCRTKKVRMQYILPMAANVHQRRRRTVKYDQFRKKKRMMALSTRFEAMARTLAGNGLISVGIAAALRPVGVSQQLDAPRPAFRWARCGTL